MDDTSRQSGESVTCACCGKVRRPHERSTRLCWWCYQECTNEGCTDRYFDEFDFDGRPQ